MRTGSDSGDGYHPWTTYIYAREEARRRGDRRVGTDHLVLGLLHDPEMPSVLGVTLEAGRSALDSLDQEALATLGFAPTFSAPHLPMRETPARPTVHAVLRDRLPLTPAAKAALQQAGKPMRRGKHITAEEVLLRILDARSPDPSAVLLIALGVDGAAVRERLRGSSSAA
jgi:hypothetical protein